MMSEAAAAAIVEIIDTLERQTHKRRLHGSAADQAAHETARAAWTALYAAPFIEHRAGRSFQRPGCATCYMQGTVATTAAERAAGALSQKACPGCGALCWVGAPDVGAAPAGHRDGTCFECSGLDAPEGFSQAERKARAMEVAAMPKLRMVMR